MSGDGTMDAADAMGAAAAVQRAGVAAIERSTRLPVFDGVGMREVFPYMVLSETATVDWGVKGAEGREVRLGFTVWDEPGRMMRIEKMMSAAERQIGKLSGVLEGGWTVAGVALIRTLVERGADGPWAGMVEHRVRVTRPAVEG